MSVIGITLCVEAFATPFGSEANYTTFSSLGVNAEKHSDLNQVCSLYFHIDVFLLYSLSQCNKYDP